MSLLDKLNSEQYEAVTTTDGPVLLLAGAGSGKTRVIVYRIAHLIEEKQIRPDRILAVTFTNKAAEEMKNRVKSLIAPERLSPPPQISTFHSLCVRILRRDIDKLVFEGQTKNYTKDFTIYDTDDQLKVIKGCMKDLNIDQKMIAPKVIQSSISSAKSKGLSWENMHSTAVEYGSDLKREATTRVYKMYQERLMTVNALDFDDLLLKTVLLLRNSNETRIRYNERFQYIMIDEYQDTNPPQFALVRLLTEVQQNLCVVGDPDQSIYKFRSADIQNILDFEKHYPRAKTIKLLKNYRSTQNILEAANEVIRNNKQRREKDLHTDNEKGEKLRYYQAFDGDNEASFVADRIKRHLADDPNTRCVILYRTNAQSRLFEEGCRRASLRYNMIGGFSFYERAEIKDIIAYLKFLLNPNDDVALSRIINTPPRGIGKATLEAIQTTATLNKISHWDAIKIIVEEESAGRGANALRSFCKTIERLHDAMDDLTLSELVKTVMIETNYTRMLQEEDSEEAESRLMNLEELVSAAAESENNDETLADFLDHAALVSDTDNYKQDAQVTLMTVHSAKGLEFPIVFLVGMEQGLFPHSRAVDNPVELEEERRLCYVAITRAERHLYISHALSRRIYGEETPCEPSQFLYELPTELMEDFSRGTSWLKSRLSGTDSRHNYAASAANYGGSRSFGLTKSRTNYGGKSYNNVDSIKDFFKQKGIDTSTPIAAKTSTNDSEKEQKPVLVAKGATGFKPGMYVEHPKYGQGLVLRREGEGDSAKLLISFQGFGQKKLVEKFANLKKA